MTFRRLCLITVTVVFGFICLYLFLGTLYPPLLFLSPTMRRHPVEMDYWGARSRLKWVGRMLDGDRSFDAFRERIYGDYTTADIQQLAEYGTNVLYLPIGEEGRHRNTIYCLRELPGGASPSDTPFMWVKYPYGDEVYILFWDGTVNIDTLGTGKRRYSREAEFQELMSRISPKPRIYEFRTGKKKGT